MGWWGSRGGGGLGVVGVRGQGWWKSRCSGSRGGLGQGVVGD